MPPGRPPAVASGLIVDAVLKYREELKDGNGNIVSQNNEVWQNICLELESKVQPATLYSYVMNNRFDLKIYVTGKVVPSKMNTKNDDYSEVESDESDEENHNFRFVMTFTRSEFDTLIVETSKTYRDPKGTIRQRVYNIMQPQKWTELFSKRVYDEFRLSHGYHFENHFINSDKASGKFQGHCKCGSKIKAEILPHHNNEEIVKISCTASNGNKSCGKRQLRGETRDLIVSDLEKESTHYYRAKTASKLMGSDEQMEPPHLYAASVCRNAKYEAAKKRDRKADPLDAISDLKRSSKGHDIVRDIGKDPVKIFIWSPHQIRAYNKLRKKSRLCIDASGGRFIEYIHVDGKKSQHIFLHIAVLHCEFGQFVVSSMLSEKQDMVSLTGWLLRWIQTGAQYTKEVVCDSSRALLSACCLAFATCDTVEAYADACMSEKLPRTYIRIDVAHYIKNWADFFKNEKKLVKRFYMFGIGQLILATNPNDARTIIKALLIISLCKKGGDGAKILKDSVKLIENQATHQKDKINSILDNLEDTNENSGSEENTFDDESPDESTTSSYLLRWAGSIKQEVDKIVKCEEGDDLNPRECELFAIRLLKQIRTIPLWSCICQPEFGYGRIPASSAPVEIEFKSIKNEVLKARCRIDLAAEKLITYFDGSTKLIDCSLKKGRMDPNALMNDKDVSVKESTFETVDQSFFRDQILDITLSPTNSYLNNVFNTLIDLPPGVCFLCKNIIKAGKIIDDDDHSIEVCEDCFESSHNSPRVTLKSIENWRGLGKAKATHRNRALYLNKENINDNDIFSTKLNALPILRNGNDNTLSLVPCGNSNFSLNNTCAFDSIFQVLLAGVSDCPKVMGYVENKQKSNDLFDTVISVNKNNIGAQTYKRRAQIMLEFLQKTPQGNKIESIDCSCNIISLANFIFKSTPSFKELSVCTSGCNSRITEFPSITITQKELVENLEQAVGEHVALLGTRCLKASCRKINENSIHDITDIVLIGLDIDYPMKLSTIPESFRSPKNGEIFKLMGFVNFVGPPVTRRISSVTCHYKAFAKKNAHWSVYDDLLKKSHRPEKNESVKP